MEWECRPLYGPDRHNVLTIKTNMKLDQDLRCCLTLWLGAFILVQLIEDPTSFQTHQRLAGIDFESSNRPLTPSVAVLIEGWISPSKFATPTICQALRVSSTDR